MITREMFVAATGREPENDDLDRCNCPDAGKYGHSMCGWDHTSNKPVFETGSQIYVERRRAANDRL